ncbi:MAG: hypothetical protein ACYC7D_00370 [Nitrososphaerales archaeon]
MARLIEKSEALLVIVTAVFQLLSMITLLRVATGDATTSPSTSGSGPVIVVPTSLNQSISVPTSTPQFQNPVGGGLDPALLLAIVFVGANIVVISLLAYLYRKKKMKLFSIIISVFLIFNVTELYASFLLGLYSNIPLIAALSASVVTIFAALIKSTKLINILALLLALELGSSFPVLLQTPLNWIVPVVYSVFDIYAIYYGRLGRLVKQVGDDSESDRKGSEIVAHPERLKENSKKWPDFGLLTINLGKIEIGMADIAFYSMVPAVALILKSVLAFVVVMIAVDVGLIVSFYAFRNKEVAPGLPIPILSGLAALLIVSLI